jgi:hypothetical protein
MNVDDSIKLFDHIVVVFFIVFILLVCVGVFDKDK